MDNVFRTISCDGPGCEKTVTFNQKDPEEIKKSHEDNPWLNTSRVIQTGDGRTFIYHDDVCEVQGVASGKHNPPEQKKILEIPTGADYAIKSAAAAAAQKAFAEKAIKAGEPVTLHTA